MALREGGDRGKGESGRRKGERGKRKGEKGKAEGANGRAGEPGSGRMGETGSWRAGGRRTETGINVATGFIPGDPGSGDRGQEDKAEKLKKGEC